MNRKEVCALIREYELQEEVKARFGDNYTRIPTKKLEEVIWDYDCTLVDNPYEDEEDNVESNEHKAATETKVSAPTNELDNPYEAACLAFVGILKDNGMLDELLAKL